MLVHKLTCMLGSMSAFGHALVGDQGRRGAGHWHSFTRRTGKCTILRAVVAMARCHSIHHCGRGRPHALPGCAGPSSFLSARGEEDRGCTMCLSWCGATGYRIRRRCELGNRSRARPSVDAGARSLVGGELARVSCSLVRAHRARSRATSCAPCTCRTPCIACKSPPSTATAAQPGSAPRFGHVTHPGAPWRVAQILCRSPR